LSKSNNIFILKRKNSVFTRNELNKYHFFDIKFSVKYIRDLLIDNNIDLIIHLASYAPVQHNSEDISELINTNVMFGAILLESMATSKTKRLISASSHWQYYHSKEYRPSNLYAATKQALSSIQKFYTEFNNLEIVELLIYETYGPGDSRNKVLNILKNSISNSVPIDLSLGEQKLDYVYLDDVVRAFESAITQLFSGEIKPGSAFGIYANKTLSLREIVDFINKKTENKLKVNFGNRVYRKGEVMYPSYPFPQLPKWKPLISFDKGIDLFLETK